MMLLTLVVALLAVTGCAAVSDAPTVAPPLQSGLPVLPPPGRSPVADELVYGRLHPDIAFPARVRAWPFDRLVLRLCAADLPRLVSQLSGLPDAPAAPVAWYLRQMVAVARTMVRDVLGPSGTVVTQLYRGDRCPTSPRVVRVRFAAATAEPLAPRCAQTFLPTPEQRSIVMRADLASADRCLSRLVFPAMFAHELAHALGLFHTSAPGALLNMVVEPGEPARLSKPERHWARLIYAAARRRGGGLTGSVLAADASGEPRQQPARVVADVR